MDDYVKFIPLTHSEEVARKINYRQGKQLENQLRCLEQEERHCTSIMKKKVMGLNREMERLMTNRENCLRYITVAEDGTFCIQLTRQKRLKDREDRRSQATTTRSTEKRRHSSTGRMSASILTSRQRLPSLPDIVDGTIVTSKYLHVPSVPTIPKPIASVLKEQEKQPPHSAPVCTSKENKENSRDQVLHDSVFDPPSGKNRTERQTLRPVYDPRISRNVDTGWIMNIRSAEDAFDLTPLTQVLDTASSVLPILPNISDNLPSGTDNRKSKNQDSPRYNEGDSCGQKYRASRPYTAV